MCLYRKHTNNQEYWTMQSDNKLISLLSFIPSYTVVTLGTEMSWVCLGLFFFPVKGRDGRTECALLSPCLFLSFSNSVLRQFVSPLNIFLKFHDSPAKSNRACWGGQQLHAPYTAVLFFCLMRKCALVCAHLFCLYFDRILEDIPLKKKKKNEKKMIKKNKGSMAINSFKKTMENSAWHEMYRDGHIFLYSVMGGVVHIVNWGGGGI